jgi:hypothetical protein
MNTYGIQQDGSLVLIEPVSDPGKRRYTRRNVGDTSRSSHYPKARNRALRKLKDAHPQEFEALFAEELKKRDP